MAWQRAKGNMMAFLEAFQPEYDPKNGRLVHGFCYDIARDAIDECIKTIEDNI